MAWIDAQDAYQFFQQGGVREQSRSVEGLMWDPLFTRLVCFVPHELRRRMF